MFKLPIAGTLLMVASLFFTNPVHGQEHIENTARATSILTGFAEPDQEFGQAEEATLVNAAILYRFESSEPYIAWFRGTMSSSLLCEKTAAAFRQVRSGAANNKADHLYGNLATESHLGSTLEPHISLACESVQVEFAKTLTESQSYADSTRLASCKDRIMREVSREYPKTAHIFHYARYSGCDTATVKKALRVLDDRARSENNARFSHMSDDLRSMLGYRVQLAQVGE